MGDKNFFNIQKQLLTLYLCIAVGGIGMGVVIPLIPLTLRDQGISTTTIGLIATTMSVSGALFAVPIGKLVDKFGSKVVLLTGLAIYGVCMLIFPFAKTIISYYIIRAIEGIGWAAIWVGTETIINLLSSPEDRIRNLGLYGVFTGLGIGVGPLLGMTGVERFGNYFPFIISFVISLLAMLMVLFFVENIKASYKKEKQVDSYLILGLIQLPLLAAFLYGVTETTVTSFLSLYLRELGLNSVETGTIITIFVLGGIAVPPLVGFFVKGLNKFIILLAAGLSLTACTLAFPWFKTSLLLNGGTLILGGSAGLLYVTALSIIGDRVDRSHMGTGNALFTSLYGIGSIVGPITGGVSYQYFGPRFIFYQIAAMAAVGLILILIIRLTSLIYRKVLDEKEAIGKGRES
ncbi:Predicted arabinose efflux permease, MFS family [Carboxydocella sporoproducens DSM 16521]|uniref:Predicted arabinose efflux permease, MFS family n=3 Tax=Carboxydocella TaxID=178898 RepID=A0A1T4R0I3_9FIRM|nr:MFS transporter [Carboxydocella sporoproducens]AVX19810.1 putative arabinose efflux permease, MFS family [Carboxydocella thermautotrophica]SKA09490.1 Predicted arabinose efflux permease, MFS family [Carboxydocella sporoproducens DSM 16521]